MKKSRKDDHNTALSKNNLLVNNEDPPQIALIFSFSFWEISLIVEL